MKIKIKIGNFSKPRDFYTYIHMKETTGEIFYVGKGQGNRFKTTKSRSEYWKRTAKKYGVIVDIVAHGISEHEALLLEKKLIKIYGRKNLGTGNLVNLTDGGEGYSGYICTDETRRKLSEAGKGRKHTEEHKQYMSDIMKGRVFSDETILKMRNARLGKKLTEEQRIKARDSRPSSRKVVCMETGEVFKSASEAARWVGVDTTSICKVCKGKHKHAKGFKFKYFEEENAA